MSYMSAETAYVVKDLEGIRQLPPDIAVLKGENLGDPEVIAIASLQSLRGLDLSGCDEITDCSVSELCRLSSLEKLDLGFCNQITDVSLGTLARLPVLRSLNLNWCYGLTDLGMGALRECESLESISLWSCEGITDRGVEALAGLPNLKNLELPEFAAITDNGLSALSANAAGLEALRLDHLTGISGKGLVGLGELTQLRSLRVHSCPNVTADAIARLQKALPGCQISFLA